jgi:hypothetical protein
MQSDINVTIIIPPVVVHHLDPHTGIPFMPHMAANVAGALREDSFNIQVLDCFGLQPNQRILVDDLMLLGLSPSETVALIDQKTEVCLIYCRTMSEFLAIEIIVNEIAIRRQEIKVVLFENVQAVTSFSLYNVAEEFFQKSVHVLVMGEPERRMGAVINNLLSHGSMQEIPGIAFKQEDGSVFHTGGGTLESDLDLLPMPAWDLFPLEGYWVAGFAHAPCKNERFLPILTSRGCPFKCKFCLAPFVNPEWRARSAEHVVDEMEHFKKIMGVTDFHISDLNPTVNEKRIQAICQEIIRRKLRISWKLAQGTKIETIKNEKTLELMAEAGCRFIAFSPETGSKKLLKTVKKPFDHEHGLRMARKMVSLGITVQACFLAGLPEETAADQKQTLEYVKKLVKLGVDEISCYIFTPVPGSELSQAINGFCHFSQCTPSPNWRSDYDDLSQFRFKMYRTYFLYKLLYPFKVLREIKGFLTGQYETKMAMSVFKQFKLLLLRYCPWLFSKLDSSAQLRNIKTT